VAENPWKKNMSLRHSGGSLVGCAGFMFFSTECPYISGAPWQWSISLVCTSCSRQEESGPAGLPENLEEVWRRNEQYYLCDVDMCDCCIWDVP
jgi:hypothetical protein